MSTYVAGQQRLSLQDLKAAWQQTPLAGKTTAEIVSTLEQRIDSWSSLAAAKQDLQTWLPLLVAAVEILGRTALADEA